MLGELKSFKSVEFLEIHDELSSKNTNESRRPYFNILYSNGVKVKYQLRLGLDGIGYEASIVGVHTSPIELALFNS